MRRYLEKVSGLSRAQMTRLIAQFRATGRIRNRRGPSPSPAATPRPAGDQPVPCRVPVSNSIRGRTGTVALAE